MVLRFMHFLFFGSNCNPQLLFFSRPLSGHQICLGKTAFGAFNLVFLSDAGLRLPNSCFA
jgi:hypothetical protein